MCGLLGLLTTDGTSDDAVARVDAAMHCLRHRGPDEHGTWYDDRPGLRLQPAVDHRHRALAPAAALGSAGRTRPLCADVQRRDLQLPGAARGTRAASTAPRSDRGRQRGDRRRVPPTGARTAVRAAARHVRVRDLGHRDPGRCSWPATRSASSRCSSPTGRGGTAFGSEKKACWSCSDVIGIAGELDPRAIEHYTGRCSTCRNRRPCTAASAGSSPAATHAWRRARLARRPATSTRSSRPSRSPPGSEQARYTRDRRGARGLGRQAHARRRHRRARSCRAASTRPRSRRWPCGTTRT